MEVWEDWVEDTAWGGRKEERKHRRNLLHPPSRRRSRRRSFSASNSRRHSGARTLINQVRLDRERMRTAVKPAVRRAARTSEHLRVGEVEGTGGGRAVVLLLLLLLEVPPPLPAGP